MAFWQIPLFQEEDNLDSIFDDIFDWSFPPTRCRKMHHSCYDPRRKASPRRDRDQSQTSKDSHADKGNFRVSLDVRHYKPDEISLKVDGNKLLVSGKRHKKSDYGFETSQFERSYPIPDDVDAKSFTSKISENGLLEIEAPKRVVAKASGNVVQQDDTKFKAVFDVSDYKPGEVSVKVQGDLLLVSGEQKFESRDDEEGFSQYRQFSRRIPLPKTVKLESLQSRWTKEGKLIIEGENSSASEPEGRQLDIQHETDDGIMEE